jgi:hypothetical protein
MGMLLTMTRQVYRDLMDANDNLYERPTGIIGRRGLEKRRVDFLKKYICFVMTGRMVSDTTKIYIRSAGSSVAEAFRLHNTGLPEEQQINIKTAYAKVNYDRQKMLKIFPEDMLTDVATRKNPDMSRYEKLLNLAIARYARKSRLLDNLALRIPRSTLNETLTDDEFDELYSIIAPYSKHHIRAVEAALPEKMSGYLNFLVSAPDLEGEHFERFKRIQDLLA